MPARKRRFDLFDAIALIAAVIFAFVWTTGYIGTQVKVFEFEDLPPDDTALLSWLEERDRSDVVVMRTDNTITLEAKANIAWMVINGIEIVPEPPLQELMYSTPLGFRMSVTNSSLIRYPILWIIGFIVVLSIARALWRRRSAS